MCHLHLDYQELFFVALLISGMHHLGGFEIAELQTLLHLVIVFEFYRDVLLQR
jgi:hypothetical protein